MKYGGLCAYYHIRDIATVDPESQRMIAKQNSASSRSAHVVLWCVRVHSRKVRLVRQRSRLDNLAACGINSSNM